MARTFRELNEASCAAAATIAQRLAIMAAAVHDPRRLTDPELSLMASEKVEAAAAVGAAVAPLLCMPAMHAARWAQTVRRYSPGCRLSPPPSPAKPGTGSGSGLASGWP
jgi:hypothetical protein